MGRGRKLSKYKVIQFYDEKESWPVEWMCRSLEVSRVGYYKWLKHEITEEEKENEIIAQLIREYNKHAKDSSLRYKRLHWFGLYFKNKSFICTCGIVLPKMMIRPFHI